MLEAIPACAATVSYGGLALHASRSVINPMGLTGDSELIWKKEKTKRVLGFFWVMLVMVGFMVIIRLATPAILDVLEPDEGTWEKGAPDVMECPAENPTLKEEQSQPQAGEPQGTSTPGPAGPVPAGERGTPEPGNFKGDDIPGPGPPGEPADEHQGGR